MDDKRIYFPEAYHEYCTERVLVLEYIKAHRISDIRDVEEIDTSEVLTNLVDFVYNQILKDGYFHADPHPGNIVVTDEGIIVPLDYGQVGRISSEMLSFLSELLIAFLQKKLNRIVHIFIEMDIIPQEANLKVIKSELDSLIYKFYGMPLEHIEFKLILNEMFAFFNKHDLKMPYDLALLAKALGTYEDIIFKLEPESNFFDVSKPYLRKAIRSRWKFEDLFSDGLHIVEELRRLINILPRELRYILQKLRSDNIKINFDMIGLKQLIFELDRVSNRLSISMIISSLIIGSSLILRLNKPPFLFGYPALGIIGYLFAGILGVILIISIIRSGKW